MLLRESLLALVLSVLGVVLTARAQTEPARAAAALVPAPTRAHPVGAP